MAPTAVFPAKAPGDRQLASWCRQAAGGNRTAEAHLVEALYPEIWRIVHSWRPRHQDAEDIVQDTFCHAIRNLRAGQPREAEKVRSYVLGIARNVYFGSGRGRPGRETIAETERLACPNTPDPLDRVIWLADRRRLMQAIGSLSQPRDRALIRARLFDGLGPAEMCPRLGVSRDHYHRILYRARHRLKKNMAVSHPGSGLGRLSAMA